jgi:hypothetical protein
MLAFVVGHIDLFSRFGDGLKGRFAHLSRFAHKCHHSAVGIYAGINVQQVDSPDMRDGIRNSLDHLAIPTLGKIRYALDEFHN